MSIDEKIHKIVPANGHLLWEYRGEHDIYLEGNILEKGGELLLVGLYAQNQIKMRRREYDTKEKTMNVYVVGTPFEFKTEIRFTVPKDAEKICVYEVTKKK